MATFNPFSITPSSSASAFLKSITQSKTTTPTNTASVKTASTTTTPTVTATPSATNPVIKTPAAQTYIQNQIPTTDNSDALAEKARVALASNQNTSTVQNTSTTPTTTTSTGNSYLDYLTSQFNPTNVDNAQKAYQTSAQKLAGIQNEEEAKSLAARREQNTLLDTAGGTRSGAIQSASVAERRSNSELADLAVQESAAARSAQVAKDTYDTYINAGKTVYEAKQASDKAASEEKQKTFENDLATKTFNENVRKNGLDYALKQQELGIKQAKDSGTDAATTQVKQQSASQSLGLINSLLASDVSKITGAGQNPLNIAGITNAKAINEYNQLQGLLKLGIRGLLKGQGAVSDYEGKVLGQAASSLGRNLSNAEFEQTLKDIRGAIKTNSGQSTEVIVTNPKTGETKSGELDGNSIYDAVSQGFIIKYK